MKQLGKRRIAQIILVIVIVGFAIRESRVLWGIEELEWFDLGYWGIQISDEVYTLQNMSVIWGGVVVLVLLSWRDSLKVLSMTTNAPESSPTGESPIISEGEPENSGGREKNPFEMVNSKWKVVLGNPKAKQNSEFSEQNSEKEGS